MPSDLKRIGRALLSVSDKSGLIDFAQALANEYEHGLRTIRTRELVAGLERYASGSWRSPTE